MQVYSTTCHRFYTITPAPLRFWPKVRAISSGCWEWQSTKSSAGYGYFYAHPKSVPAHRFAYELLVGPIPDRLTLDHLCRNRACVNPLHLEPVTLHENILRGVGISARHARQTHCKNGHPYDLFNTHIGPDNSRRCRMCNMLWKRARRRTSYNATLTGWVGGGE